MIRQKLLQTMRQQMCHMNMEKKQQMMRQMQDQTKMR